MARKRNVQRPSLGQDGRTFGAVRSGLTGTAVVGLRGDRQEFSHQSVPRVRSGASKCPLEADAVLDLRAIVGASWVVAYRGPDAAAGLVGPVQKALVPVAAHGVQQPTYRQSGDKAHHESGSGPPGKTGEGQDAQNGGAAGQRSTASRLAEGPLLRRCHGSSRWWAPGARPSTGTLRRGSSRAAERRTVRGARASTLQPPAASGLAFEVLAYGRQVLFLLRQVPLEARRGGCRPRPLQPERL